MRKLGQAETILTGSWIYEDKTMRGDAICERIKWLIEKHFQKNRDSPTSGCWEILYRDPDDGRYWERTYPQGEMHGGGPPQLRFLTDHEAKDKYGLP
jgi:hypothetical protein